MKILFLTNLIPYPLDNGGKIKTFSTLKMLSDDINEIDIYSFYETREELESLEYIKKLFNDVNVIKKPLTTRVNMKKMMNIALKSLFNKLPFVLLKYKDKQMAKILKDKINKNRYDLIYIDHLQLSVYFEELKKANCPIYLDQHNCESQILKRKITTENNYFKKLLIAIEYIKLKKFEDDMIVKCDKVIVLSEEDKICLTKDIKVDENKFITIPIPVQINYVKEIGSKINNRIKILFLGTLSWFPNEQGINWFVDNIIPKLKEKNIEYELYIVGKNPDKNLMSKCENDSSIIITGYVDDVNEYIEICDVMIAPIFIGSGMRVKILEGLGKNIPIISTRIGCEGIEIEDNKSILLAENEEEFILALEKISEKELYENIQRNGKRIFEEKYSIASVTKSYRENVLEDTSGVSSSV